MPMLYLHQRNLTRSIEDLGGADFPDLEAAVDAPFQDTLSADGSVDGRKHRWIRIDAI